MAFPIRSFLYGGRVFVVDRFSETEISFR
jgi:hypothetical protein